VVNPNTAAFNKQEYTTELREVTTG